MRASPWNEVLIIQDPVVLVGDQLVDDVLILSCRHEHEILEAVVKVAPVIHVDMCGSAVPALGGHVGHPRQSDLHYGFLILRDLDPSANRLVLKTLHQR